ncbi:MAG: CoA transferase, partial [Hyphomonas sp.]
MLEGIRVVEYATYMAAPGAGCILRDWGADVIKVEPPGGDPIRLFF